jgi:NAD(P)-dependent dehydrogenase (short-subunit alcohol dehydrogenase family)
VTAHCFVRIVKWKMAAVAEARRLAGKRALVTGGDRGIGAAIAHRLAAHGAAVAINYVADAASAEALVRDRATIDASGGRM